MTFRQCVFVLGNVGVTMTICLVCVVAQQAQKDAQPSDGPTSDWKCRGEVKFHSPGIVQLAYSPDGTKLACVDYPTHGMDVRVCLAGWPTGYLRIMEAEPMARHPRRFVSSTVAKDLSFQPIRFSSDSQFVEYGGAEPHGEPHLVRWDIQQQQRERRPVEGERGWVSVSPSARVYALDRDEGHIDVLNLDDDRLVCRIERQGSQLESSLLSLDGRYLLVHVKDGFKITSTLIWNVAQNELQCEVPVQYHFEFRLTSFSPDGNLFSFVDQESRIGVFDTLTGDLVRQFDVPSQNRWCVAFSPDNRLFAVGFEQPENSDLIAQIWDITTGEVVNSLRDPKSWAITAMAFSPDSTTLATGHPDGTIRFWSPPTPEELTAEREETAEEILLNW